MGIINEYFNFKKSLQLDDNQDKVYKLIQIRLFT